MDPKPYRMRFVQFLSVLLVAISATGGFVVLLDQAYSMEMKGMVVTVMLLGGYTAVQKFWLDSTDSSQRKTELLADKQG